MRADTEVVVIGGGIHGAGVLLDLASRGITDAVLVERTRLAAGTSSRSTKLVHGGLRYLERVRQWRLVREALRERALLLELLPELVQPLSFVLPAARADRGGRSRWKLRLGLALYDLMRRDALPRSRALGAEEMAALAPYLRSDAIEATRGGFGYSDARMIDDAIVRVAARAAERHSASVVEGEEVVGVRPRDGGFRVILARGGRRRELTCRAIAHCAGAWANANLLRWGLTPARASVLDLGTHVVLDASAVGADADSAAAAILPHPSDRRVVLFVPWEGHWLLGTTDTPFRGTPDRVEPPEADVDYLLDAARRWIDLADPGTAVRETFAGLRAIPLPRRAAPRDAQPERWADEPFRSPWYPDAAAIDLARLSRESAIEEAPAGLFTLYGGKYTTFRAEARRLGDRIAARLGVSAPSRTDQRAVWCVEQIARDEPELFRSDPSLRRPVVVPAGADQST